VAALQLEKDKEIQQLEARLASQQALAQRTEQEVCLMKNCPFL
jgi:hypothetical protein